MDDSFVVKIPDPNAGPNHYTTMSEVATVAYVLHSISMYQSIAKKKGMVFDLCMFKVQQKSRHPSPKGSRLLYASWRVHTWHGMRDHGKVTDNRTLPV
jgi:hypothetical protein